MPVAQTSQIGLLASTPCEAYHTGYAAAKATLSEHDPTRDGPGTLQLNAIGQPPFEVRTRCRAAPVQTVPVFNSPHSGRVYPPDFLRCLPARCGCHPAFGRLFVDELFAGAHAALGAPMLLAHFPRAYLDVNREPYELDPRMFGDDAAAFANIASMRVAGGLGTIPRWLSPTIWKSTVTVSTFRKLWSASTGFIGLIMPVCAN